MRILGCLTLADGSTCGIAAEDPEASNLVSRLAQLMQLRCNEDPRRTVLVRSDHDEYPEVTNIGIRKPLGEKAPQIFSDPGLELAIFTAKESHEQDEFVLDLMRLSHAVLNHTGSTGSLLLHGALIEYEGQGFILAGPGGAGKSTASKRIPPPWRSHSDDMVMIVCDSKDSFWVHPWPTWSELSYGGFGPSWDVQSALPLKAIFFIHQADQDQTQVTGEGEAVCLILEVVEQASRVAHRDMDVQARRDSNMMRFEVITQLTNRIPCFKLDITKTGAFWHEIERVCHLDP